MTADRSAELDRLIADVLDERELAYQHPHQGAFFVSLPGTHKLVTNTWLVVGDHSLLVEAFVVRHPDENQAAFWHYLLERNARMYGVHFSADQLGDVYLVGRVSLDAVTADELDRLLGCVLSYSDESFDTLLELGFAESIRREWKWRVSRGESLANLQAFARFADPKRRGEEPPFGDDPSATIGPKRRGEEPPFGDDPSATIGPKRRGEEPGIPG